jgi:hypothetical protein
MGLEEVYIRFLYFPAAGTASGYGWTSGFRFPAGTREFFLLRSVHTGTGAHPAAYLTGTRAHLPGIQQPERENCHSPLSIAEAKNDGATPTFPHTSPWHDA